MIWAAIFWLGRAILGYPNGDALPDELTLTYIFEHTWDVFYPMLVGGLPTALVAWLIFFWPCYKAVARYQAHREARRARARERRAAKQCRQGRHQDRPGRGQGRAIMTQPIRLGVNIDHIATLRNARGGRPPGPVARRHARPSARAPTVSPRTCAKTAATSSTAISNG